MRVLLINPPDMHTAVISKGWDFEIGNIGLFPPFGLICLASFIRRKRGDEIKVLDCIAERLTYRGLESALKAFPADVVGITSSTYTFFDVLQTARLTRRVLPQARICLGGPHVRLFPEETMSHPEFDYLLLGEAEESMVNLLERIEKGFHPEGVEGLVFRDKGSLFKNDIVPIIRDLDALPFPAYDLVPGKAYRSTFGKPGRMACIATSRGCPYRCTYCQGLVKNFRIHSVEYVLEMMLSLYEEGYRSFYFFDDLFNIRAERVQEIAEAILSSGMKVNWVFRGRVSNVSREMFSRAARAGCCQILVGVEDYTDEGLKAIKKGITMQQVHQCVAWAHEFGIEVSTNWIIGLPSHRSAGDVKGLVRAAIDTHADYAQFTILQLLPGCEMFDEAVWDGVIHREAWSHFVSNPVPDYRMEPYDKHLSIEELTRLYRECHSRFYRRPAYIVRRLIKVRSREEFVQKMKVGWKVVMG